MFLLHSGFQNKGMSTEIATHSMLTLSAHGSTVGLPVLVPCQEVMAVTAGERDSWEKGAKMRKQETTQFLHSIPGCGCYLCLAHKFNEGKVLFHGPGAGGDTALGCLVLSGMRADTEHIPERK